MSVDNLLLSGLTPQYESFKASRSKFKVTRSRGIQKASYRNVLLNDRINFKLGEDCKSNFKVTNV